MRGWAGRIIGYAVLAGMVGLTCFAVRVNLIGGIFVRDPQAVTRAITIEYERRTEPLWRLPGGLYFAWPEGSGELVLSCANGRRVERAIVVPYMTFRSTILPEDCSDRLSEIGGKR
jgi:hypothetical protein